MAPPPVIPIFTEALLVELRLTKLTPPGRSFLMPDYALTQSEPEEPSHLEDLAIRAAQTSPEQEPAIVYSRLCPAA